LNEFLRDSGNWLPLAGLAVLGVAAFFFWARRKPETAEDIERQRRAYLNRVGRIVEGQILEISEHGPDSISSPFGGPLEQQLVARERLVPAAEGATTGKDAANEVFETIAVGASAKAAVHGTSGKARVAATRKVAASAGRGAGKSTQVNVKVALKSTQPQHTDAKKSHPHSPLKSGGFFSRRSAPVPDGTRKLLYYTYAISGVTYETAQDVTGLEERLHLSRVAAGQTASVKFDPSNPSNSILLADDWSGLH
jgi:LPXTG-motif cell wall-anchored protein